MAPKSLPNGTAEIPIEVTASFAPVVGINFGNSFASIAVLTKVPFSLYVRGSGALIQILGNRKVWLNALQMKMVNARSHVLSRSKAKKW